MRYELYQETHDGIELVYRVVMMAEELEVIMNYVVHNSLREEGDYIILDHIQARIFRCYDHDLVLDRDEAKQKKAVYGCKLAKVTAADRSGRNDHFPLLDQRATEETERFFELN